jgi:glycosyltransferase involved in cell wall biosynthesis
LSGVQRYAREMVNALDRLLCEEKEKKERWCLLTTGRETQSPRLKRIDVRPVPTLLFGHAWEQLVLARAARGGVLIGFGGSGPISHRRQLVIVHDATVFRHPRFFSTAYGTWHRWIDRELARRARIATVSRFSRQELAELLKLDPDSIPVFANGSDHMTQVVPSIAPLKRFRLGERPYFVVLGNITRNKNVAAALEALRHVPDCDLVVVGASVRRIFAAPGTAGQDERLINVGRLNDAEVAGILEHASALLFPSIYEGFGIPPLEAMRVGCPVIASNIPAVRETCNGAALYFDPNDPLELADRMRAILNDTNESRAEWIRLGKARAADFTWERSAKRLLDFCRSELLPRETGP